MGDNTAADAALERWRKSAPIRLCAPKAFCVAHRAAAMPGPLCPGCDAWERELDALYAEVRESIGGR